MNKFIVRDANKSLIRLFIYSFINTDARILRNLMNNVRFVAMQWKKRYICTQNMNDTFFPLIVPITVLLNAKMEYILSTSQN